MKGHQYDGDRRCSFFIVIISKNKGVILEIIYKKTKEMGKKKELARELLFI